MKIIAIEKEKDGLSTDDFKPHLKQEAEMVWQLQQQDIIREIHFRADEHCAVLILECESTAKAKSTLAELPLVKHGLIDFELIPLKPYPGLQRLFAQ